MPHVFHKCEDFFLYGIVANNDIIYTLYMLGKSVFTVRSEFYKNTTECVRKLQKINVT